MSHVSSRRRLVLVAAAAIGALAATAGPAMAGDRAACPTAALSNPFAPWGDVADYQLAPGGDVEGDTTDWSLSGGATAVEGNETFMVSSAADHMSMRLPSSSSAMTARMCIGAEHPSFRFFAKRSAGAPSSRLLVEVVFDDANGRTRSLPVGLISGSGAWAPSPPLPTLLSLLSGAQDSTIDASFRFKPQNNSTWSVDDVYVDPRRIG